MCLCVCVWGGGGVSKANALTLIRNKYKYLLCDIFFYKLALTFAGRLRFHRSSGFFPSVPVTFAHGLLYLLSCQMPLSI